MKSPTLAKRMIAVAVYIVAMMPVSAAMGENILLPDDSGVANVRRYGAKGDGKTDDTAAIQKAIAAGAGGVIYFPNGTYLISDTLAKAGSLHAPMTLQGQSTAGTIIKLKDNCPGFNKPGGGKHVVWTRKMGSADNYRNHFRNLTIDTGKANPGAIGLGLMSNNMGAVDTVVIRSGDGKGACGLDLALSLNGPLLVTRVTIVGFDVGIRTRGAVNSQVIEHLTLKGQNEAGIINGGQVLSCRGIISDNKVTAVRNLPGGVLTLIDCKLTGGASDNAAVVNESGKQDGVMFVRNLTTAGYGTAIKNAAGTERNVQGPGALEYASHPVRTAFGNTDRRSLNLPIKETPDVEWETDPSKWANVRKFGAKGDKKADDTDAIQEAIDSGATHVYFPRGNYAVKGTVEIRGSVRRILGLESMIHAPEKEMPAINLAEGNDLPPVVVVDELNLSPWNGATHLDNGSSRTLVLKHIKGGGGRYTGKGDVFIEDMGSGVKRPMEFVGGQNVWIRHLSNEPRNGVTHLVNKGGKVWILGHKTEMAGVLAETSAGGKTEILGAFCYSGIGGDCSKYPMYIVGDACAMSGTMGGSHFAKKRPPYRILLRQTRGGQTKELMLKGLPARAGLNACALFVATPE